jgi:hypothetical protein
MEVDYPAAHSMDTSWFAVDSAGQVALFTTGENGHAPDGEVNDISSELWDLCKPPGTEEDFDDYEDLCQQVGLYYFDYSDHEFDPISHFYRSVVPATPLHLDQLPPDLRERARLWRFDLRFDQVDRLQPLEFVPCVFWYEDRVAYLCADGKTVKPLPGQESRFASFVREFRQQHLEAAKSLIFDGPTD